MNLTFTDLSPEAQAAERQASHFRSSHHDQIQQEFFELLSDHGSSLLPIAPVVDPETTPSFHKEYLLAVLSCSQRHFQSLEDFFHSVRPAPFVYVIAAYIEVASLEVLAAATRIVQEGKEPVFNNLWQATVEAIDTKQKPQVLYTAVVPADATKYEKERFRASLDASWPYCSDLATFFSTHSYLVNQLLEFAGEGLVFVETASGHDDYRAMRRALESIPTGHLHSEIFLAMTYHLDSPAAIFRRIFDRHSPEQCARIILALLMCFARSEKVCLDEFQRFRSPTASLQHWILIDQSMSLFDVCLAGNDVNSVTTYAANQLASPTRAQLLQLVWVVDVFLDMLVGREESHLAPFFDLDPADAQHIISVRVQFQPTRREILRYIRGVRQQSREDLGVDAHDIAEQARKWLSHVFCFPDASQHEKPLSLLFAGVEKNVNGSCGGIERSHGILSPLIVSVTTKLMTDRLQAVGPSIHAQFDFIRSSLPSTHHLGQHGTDGQLQYPAFSAATTFLHRAKGVVLAAATMAQEALHHNVDLHIKRELQTLGGNPRRFRLNWQAWTPIFQSLSFDQARAIATLESSSIPNAPFLAELRQTPAPLVLHESHFHPASRRQSHVPSDPSHSRASPEPSIHGDLDWMSSYVYDSPKSDMLQDVSTVDLHPFAQSGGMHELHSLSHSSGSGGTIWQIQPQHGHNGQDALSVAPLSLRRKRRLGLRDRFA
ncbi:hypothetical protein ACM66B_001722 [Microbotryomycetes sp. NB124-2]